MKIQDYCKAMLAEVTAWKEKLEAMKKVADSYGTEQKEKIRKDSSAYWTAGAGGCHCADARAEARNRVPI
jgi:hypothetical protein